MSLADTRDLTDVQWKMMDDLIPEPMRRRDGRGRPWKDRRAVLNGILWVLRTGAPWADVPERYPSYHLPPTISAVGPLWSDERNPRNSCFRSQSPRGPRRKGGFHRWELRPG